MNIIEIFTEWKEWESIMHWFVFLFILFIFYKLYLNPKEFNITNMLLITIILVIDTLIHQNINIRNNVKPTYSL